MIGILLVSLNLIAQETGVFTDARNGKSYNTITIGSQTWMAENLAYKEKEGCWAYNDNEDNSKINGFLYDWKTAKKVCPSGWHLPSDSEWEKLVNHLGGETQAGAKLKTKYTEGDDNSNASNETGFRALLAGYFDEQNYIGFNHTGIWCSSSTSRKLFAKSFSVQKSSKYVSSYSETKGIRYSVRCIKD